VNATTTDARTGGNVTPKKKPSKRDLVLEKMNENKAFKLIENSIKKKKETTTDRPKSPIRQMDLAREDSVESNQSKGSSDLSKK